MRTLVLTLLLCGMKISAQHLLPQPLTYKKKEGVFDITSETYIHLKNSSNTLKKYTKRFAFRLQNRAGIVLKTPEIQDTSNTHEIKIECLNVIDSIGLYVDESYNLTVSASSISIKAKTNIGYESISEVENLIFRDKEMNVQSDIIDVFKLVTSADDITGKIYRLYNAAFSRFPDANGLKYWIDKNTLGVDSYRDTANSFLASKEFIMKYGNQTTNEEYLNNVYENVLGRLPDTIGFNYWINQLNRGHENRAEILMGFAESVENKQIFSRETNLFYN